LVKVDPNFGDPKEQYKDDPVRPSHSKSYAAPMPRRAGISRHDSRV
jgi:hypothetical protein